MTESTNAGETLVSRYAADPDFAELIELFVRELPDRLAAIESAVADGDVENVERLAHQLKGAAGGYGFDVITECARNIEQHIREQASASHLDAEVAKLRTLCQRAARA